MIMSSYAESCQNKAREIKDPARQEEYEKRMDTELNIQEINKEEYDKIITTLYEDTDRQEPREAQ